MVKHHHIKKEIHKFADYETFAAFVDKLPEKGPHAYFLFTGTHRENDRSWCISCQLAEPVIKAFLEELKKSFVFGYVEVGDPVTWRLADCPFRTDKRLRLMMIPTLVKWKGVQRLEGSQCNKRELLQMMFEDEEEHESREEHENKDEDENKGHENKEESENKEEKEHKEEHEEKEKPCTNS